MILAIAYSKKIRFFFKFAILYVKRYSLIFIKKKLFSDSE